MTMPPLALTDQQLDLVTRAAAMIPVHDRYHFLQSVANRIGDMAHPSDDDIREGLDFILNARGVIVGGVEDNNRTRTRKEEPMRYSDETAFDENNVLRDNRSVRVSLHDADTSRTSRRQAGQPNRITDGRTGDAMALHRPGFRVNASDARQPVRDAYAKSDKRAGHQWKCGDGDDLCEDCDGEGFDQDGNQCPTCHGTGVMPDVEDSKGKGGFGSGNEGGYKGTASDAAARRRQVEDAYRAYDFDIAQAYRRG